MSSLVFVVILAVWAVYLVQHWVRRRDHLATARSVDRFSESMRVLERRRVLTRPDLTEATPRSYAVSPLRPASPQVTVKRGATTAPVVTASPAARPRATAPTASTTTVGATAVPPSPAYRRARSAAKVRALALLVATVAMLACVVLGAAGTWPWWTTLAGVGLLVATLAGVRSSVARERRARMAARRAARPSAPRTSSEQVARPAASVTVRPTARPAARAAEQPVKAAEEVAPVTVSRRTARAVDLYDIDAVEAQVLGATVVPEEPAEAVATPVEVVRLGAAEVQRDPGAWSPVPVPPPTYTLKARASRPAGSSHLPGDGFEMGLAEEDEELPRIHRVG